MKEIPLTRGRVAFVDDEDFDVLNKMKWHTQVNSGKYPLAQHCIPNGKYGQRRINMHHLILKPGPGQVVDHIDGNTLNNQRSNLRITDRHGNGCNCGMRKNNSSGFKGVSQNAAGRWIAQITVKREFHWIGSYATKEEAAAAYDAAASILHGEFARTNKKLGLI